MRSLCGIIMTILLYLIVGLTAGMVGGALGLGGGAIMVPIFVLLNVK